MKIKAQIRSESDAEALRAKAWTLTKTAAELNVMAAECYFKSNNKPDCNWRFDLHGFRVSEAEEFVLAKLEEWVSGALGNLPKLTFVLGKGNHSADGVAKLLPAIETLLRESCPELVAEVREGEIIVSKDRLKSHDNPVDLRAKLRTLPFELTATADYPCYLHDKIAVEVYEILQDLTVHCREYLAENWKWDADTTVRVVALLAEFGIQKPLEDLLVNGHLEAPHISDNNVTELMELCKQHSLDNIMSDCGRYISEHWKSPPGMALRAVELADKMNLPNLAKEFIPLAACCAAEDIRPFRQKISAEYFRQIVAEFYRVLITDDNVEKYAATAGFELYTEDFLLLNWKCPEKVAKAAELCAKHGLYSCLAKLFCDDNLNRCNITDENIEQLLSVCQAYPDKLFALKAECLQYITKTWSDKPEKALHAVEIADKMNLPNLAAKFIPLAACCQAKEISRFREKISAERFDLIITAFYRKRISDANIEKFAANPRLKAHAEIFLLSNWSCPEKVDKAVELCAKHGLDDCLAKLFRDNESNRCNITDENVGHLFSLCKKYPEKLTSLKADCVQHVTETWCNEPLMALPAVEISDKAVPQPLVLPQQNPPYVSSQDITVPIAPEKPRDLISLPTAQSYSYPQLRQRQREICTVSHVNDPESFFVQLLDNKEDLVNLMTSMQAAYARAVDDSSDLASGFGVDSPCAFVFPGTSAVWCRGKISQLSSLNFVMIHNVDVGTKHLVPWTNVRALRPDLLRIAPFAVQCRLYGVAKTGVWIDEEVGAFEQMVSGGIVLQTLFHEEVEPQLYAVELFTNDGRNLNIEFGRAANTLVGALAEVASVQPGPQMQKHATVSAEIDRIDSVECEQTGLLIDFTKIQKDVFLAPSVGGGFVEDDAWLYSDSHGTIQGPFDGKKMAAWFRMGYFTMTMLVKRKSDDQFLPLADLVKKYGRVPFGEGPPAYTPMVIGASATIPVGFAGSLESNSNDSHYFWNKLLSGLNWQLPTMPLATPSAAGTATLPAQQQQSFPDLSSVQIHQPVSKPAVAVSSALSLVSVTPPVASTCLIRPAKEDAEVHQMLYLCNLLPSADNDLMLAIFGRENVKFATVMPDESKTDGSQTAVVTFRSPEQAKAGYEEYNEFTLDDGENQCELKIVPFMEHLRRNGPMQGLQCKLEEPSREPTVKMEAFINANCVEFPKQSWRCWLCGEKFRGSEVVRVHILCDHMDKIGEFLQEGVDLQKVDSKASLKGTAFGKGHFGQLSAEDDDDGWD